MSDFKTQRELLEALLSGKRITNANLCDHQYVFLNELGEIVDNDGDSQMLGISTPGEWSYWQAGGPQVFWRRSWLVKDGLLHTDLPYGKTKYHFDDWNSEFSTRSNLWQSKSIEDGQQEEADQDEC